MSSDSSQRIPKEQAQVFKTWALPDIDSATGRIISSEEKRQQDELARKPKADEIIEVVEEVVKLPTAQEIETITEQAQQEGYQHGLDEGLAKGLAEGLEQGQAEGLAKIQAELEPELKQQIELLQQLSLQLSQAFKDQETVLQPLILQMVENLSRQFIGRALEASSALLLPLIEQAVKELPAGAEQLVIEYNSPKPEQLQQALQLGDMQWRLQENLELSLGSCKISSKNSSVEIDMEQRLEQLFQQFCAGTLGAEANFKADEIAPSISDPDANATKNSESNADTDPALAPQAENNAGLEPNTVIENSTAATTSQDGTLVSGSDSEAAKPVDNNVDD